jgi:hypothetical protein
MNACWSGLEAAVALEDFNGGDLFASSGGDSCLTRADGFAIEENGAGAALAFAAAVFSTG